VLRSLAIALGLSIWATSASAQPTFDVFQNTCVTANADRAVALAKADADGWMPIPKAMLDAFQASKNDPTGNVTDADGRMRSDKDGMTFLIVAKSDQIAPKKKVAARVCAVAAMPGDPDGLKSAAAAFASVSSDPAVVDQKDSIGFAWRNDGAKHIPVSATDLERAASDQSVSIMIAGGQGRVAMVALAVPAK
jgi:hypothetical protein